MKAGCCIPTVAEWGTMGVNSSVIQGRGEASNPESRDDRSELPGSRLRTPRNDELILGGQNPVAAGLRPDNLAAPKSPITRRVDPIRKTRFRRAQPSRLWRS